MLASGARATILHTQCSRNQVKVLTNLFIKMDRPVAEGDAVTEAVLARRTPKLPVEPDVLAFGVGVEVRWLHIDADRKGRGSPLDTCPVVRQAIILSVDHRAWLQSCIYEQKSNRKSSVFTFGHVQTSYWTRERLAHTCPEPPLVTQVLVLGMN